MPLVASTENHPTIHEENGAPKYSSHCAFAMALGPAGSYYLLYNDDSTMKCLKTSDLRTATTTFDSPTKGSLGPALCRDGDKYWVAYREESNSDHGKPILFAETEDPSKALNVKNLRDDEGRDHFVDLKVPPDTNKHFPSTDRTVSCCVYEHQPVFAFKRGGHELALIWNTGGTWHHLPYSNDQQSEHPFSLAIPNPDGYVHHHGIHRGNEWVITECGPACTTATIDGQEQFFLAFKEHGDDYLRAGHVRDPGKVESWPKDTLKRPRVESGELDDQELRSEMAPGVVAFRGDVLMVFSNCKDEGNPEQFDSIQDEKKRDEAKREEKERHSNRLWLALFDGASKKWEEAYRLADTAGNLLPKPRKHDQTNINLLVAHNGDLLLSYPDEDKKIRLYRLILVKSEN